MKGKGLHKLVKIRYEKDREPTKIFRELNGAVSLRTVNVWIKMIETTKRQGRSNLVIFCFDEILLSPTTSAIMLFAFNRRQSVLKQSDTGDICLSKPPIQTKVNIHKETTIGQ
ncbi:unnamed protein product [Didymodactylos carnosus]|uniref:Uncharacterized protein n=1 Tax=Didymodactylos carnosus TaxID=1234261 RepID=A0A8S2DRK5_9BILA|nr:unnamed protein product [Didymodactylos carnosus]CAF3751510.1 unnamed protein product [Didymodactylos carnosus]